jgi:hypothetical protein
LHLHLVGVALISAFDTFTSGDDFGDKKRSAKKGQLKLEETTLYGLFLLKQNLRRSVYTVIEQAGYGEKTKNETLVAG